jgi:hypothetical protein
MVQNTKSEMYEFIAIIIIIFAANINDDKEELVLNTGISFVAVSEPDKFKDIRKYTAR